MYTDTKARESRLRKDNIIMFDTILSYLIFELQYLMILSELFCRQTKAKENVL